MLTPRPSLLLLVTLLLAGIAFPFAPIQRPRGDGLPKVMQPVADWCIEQDARMAAEKLPAEVQTETQIVNWVASLKAPDWAKQGKTWQLFECYRYRRYLFVTISTGPDQKRGDPENLAHTFLIHLRQRTVSIIRLGRT